MRRLTYIISYFIIHLSTVTCVGRPYCRPQSFLFFSIHVSAVNSAWRLNCIIVSFTIHVGVVVCNWLNCTILCFSIHMSLVICVGRPNCIILSFSMHVFAVTCVGRLNCIISRTKNKYTNLGTQCLFKIKMEKIQQNKKGLHIKVLVKVSGLYQSEALKPNICKIYLTVR